LITSCVVVSKLVFIPRLNDVSGISSMRAVFRTLPVCFTSWRIAPVSSSRCLKRCLYQKLYEIHLTVMASPTSMKQ
jgi:hypothetical protein